MDLSELLFRIATGFITLFILTRIIGRKEIAQMTFLNFISGIAIVPLLQTLSSMKINQLGMESLLC